MSDNLSDITHSNEGRPGASSSDAGKMMGSAQEKISEKYGAAREKMKEQWAVAKDDLDVLKQKAIGYSQSAAKATNTFAHDHPWTTAGAAVGVGALIGWLMTRRSDMPRSPR